MARALRCFMKKRNVFGELFSRLQIVRHDNPDGRGVSVGELRDGGAPGRRTDPG